MADWITPEDVAAYLDEAGLETDDNLVLSTAAVKAAVEGRRSDLFVAGDPPVFTPPDNVRAGSIMWASILYQARSAGAGVSDFGDATAMFDPLGSRRAEIMRMIGWRRPLAV